MVSFLPSAHRPLRWRANFSLLRLPPAACHLLPNGHSSERSRCPTPIAFSTSSRAGRVVGMSGERASGGWVDWDFRCVMLHLGDRIA
ncbi:hypothetical protein B0H17DRAFT_1052692 [Mycena rosella]|uniref:Uncharacterized protein n=1 Tax=Mycena rosella TaxID=1033263 RepID=A0AAD7DQB1_MYCRO|nr:hypothetical protein B0H17DRAFT_1052692 [Mycena rosella]